MEMDVLRSCRVPRLQLVANDVKTRVNESHDIIYTIEKRRLMLYGHLEIMTVEDTR